MLVTIFCIPRTVLGRLSIKIITDRQKEWLASLSKLIFKDIVKFREVLLTALSPTPHINHSSQAWCSHAVTAQVLTM